MAAASAPAASRRGGDAPRAAARPCGARRPGRAAPRAPRRRRRTTAGTHARARAEPARCTPAWRARARRGQRRRRRGRTRPRRLPRRGAACPARRRTSRSPRTCAPGHALPRSSPSLASAPSPSSLSRFPSKLSVACLARRRTFLLVAVLSSPCYCEGCAASRARATASRRAASIVFASPERKCSAPCLIARAFLMPRPVLIASFSSSSRRSSSTVL